MSKLTEYEDWGTVVSEMIPQDYGNFLHEVKQRIRKRQMQVLRRVNHELVELYWEIGELIHQKQQALSWGKSVVATPAQDLQAEFPGRNGFSAQNLWFMRQFYCAYVDKPNLQPLVREISWTKNLVIFSRYKDDLAREFYLRATARYGWTKSVLQLPEVYWEELPSPEVIAERLKLWDERSDQNV